ncbi:MAG: roadblock/LC7 domain-containing protein [Acidobacteriota bacterium]|nr:MAG: roadblock/LC7 domain-containing protein [Acidobacteriota bacterium]
MAGSGLVLHEDDFLNLSRLVDVLMRQANARFVTLIDRNGQPIAWSGMMMQLDRTALASLAAGNVAATETLARMVGESAFCALYHEGERDHLLIASVGDVAILLIAFDERSSLGLVRLRVRQIGPSVEQLMRRVLARSQADEANASARLGVPEITDEDIDNLFGDRF